MSQNNEEKEMKKNKHMEQILKEAGDRKNFRVPEGYFDRLPDRIRESVREAEPTRAHKGNRFTIPIPTLVASAAAVIAFAVMGWFYVHSLRSGEPFHGGTNASLVFDLMPGDVSEEMLYNFIEEEGISTESSRTEGKNTEAIINYLVEEGVDETLLAQQL